jgi:hypothetical protein
MFRPVNRGFKSMKRAFAVLALILTSQGLANATPPVGPYKVTLVNNTPNVMSYRVIQAGVGWVPLALNPGDSATHVLVGVTAMPVAYSHAVDAPELMVPETVTGYRAPDGAPGHIYAFQAGVGDVIVNLVPQN